MESATYQTMVEHRTKDGDDIRCVVGGIPVLRRFPALAACAMTATPFEATKAGAKRAHSLACALKIVTVIPTD